MPVDTIRFGPDREPRHWPPGWRFPGARPGKRVWLVLGAVAMAIVIVVVFVSSGGGARRAARGHGAARLLSGIRTRGTYAGLFLGGENLWRVGQRPQPVAAAMLHNGLSPLLPHDDAGEVDQLAAVRAGVVAHISDTSSPITYGALGRVVFIPAAHGPARVIGRATMIAVPPGGQEVWVQTSVQRSNGGRGAPANFRSPTWAVNLAGRRVSPVLRLPFGLAGATEQGPLTQNLTTRRLQLWNGTTGQHLPLPVPADAEFVAAGADRLVWVSYARSASALHVTSLRTGSDVTVPLPGNWFPAESFPPQPASFDPAGQRLVLPLDRTDSLGNPDSDDLFVIDTTTRTARMIPTKPLPIPISASSPADTLAGSWDHDGRLWVLAMSPYTSYYQLAFWTGAGPLRTFQIAQGQPTALSAPGPS